MGVTSKGISSAGGRVIFWCLPTFVLVLSRFASLYAAVQSILLPLVNINVMKILQWKWKQNPAVLSNILSWPFSYIPGLCGEREHISSLSIHKEWQSRQLNCIPSVYHLHACVQLSRVLYLVWVLMARLHINWQSSCNLFLFLYLFSSILFSLS